MTSQQVAAQILWGGTWKGREGSAAMVRKLQVSTIRFPEHRLPRLDKLVPWLRKVVCQKYALVTTLWGRPGHLHVVAKAADGERLQFVIGSKWDGSRGQWRIGTLKDRDRSKLLEAMTVLTDALIARQKPMGHAGA